MGGLPSDTLLSTVTAPEQQRCKDTRTLNPNPITVKTMPRLLFTTVMGRARRGFIGATPAPPCSTRRWALSVGGLEPGPLYPVAVVACDASPIIRAPSAARSPSLNPSPMAVFTAASRSNPCASSRRLQYARSSSPVTLASVATLSSSDRSAMCVTGTAEPSGTPRVCERATRFYESGGSRREGPRRSSQALRASVLSPVASFLSRS